MRLFKFLPVLLSVAGAFGQTAQIAGRVTDPSGATVPGVEVVSRNTATGAERQVQSNESGLFTITLLQPGSYELQLKHAGFKPVSQRGIALAVDQRAELNFTLEVGAVNEQIEVKASVSRLNTVEASQGQVIDNQRIVDMPLNGRNYIDLALMSGGAVQSAPGSRIGGFSAGGQRVSQNNYIMDGLDNNSVELAAAGRRAEMVQPSIDAIQEFKVQTSAYAAEYGRGMGAVVNLTIKNGTNDLHGTAFEFVRNEVFDAKNFFTPTAAAKPPFKRNQYGMSLGGPVILPKLYNGRNRTFFFGDFESGRIRETATVANTLPTLRMRGGDFSELPSTKRIIDPATGQQFPGNVIPSSRLDPVSANLAKLYPSPQTANLANNFTYLSPRRQDVDKWDVRADQNIGSADNAFFRFSRHDTFLPDTPSLPAPAYGGGNLDYITEGYNTGAGWNHIFTPSLIMSVRAGWNYARFKRDNPASAMGRNFNKEFGIPGASDVPDGGFSQMNITGYRALGIGANNPVDRNSQNRQVSGDLSWIRGRHTIKTGASLLRSQNPIYNIRNTLGTYNFNGAYSGDGASDFLLGLSNQWSWQSPVTVSMRAWNLGLYVQDDWKLNNRLSINLGIRHEVSPPWYEKYNKMGIFDIDTTPGQATLVYARGDGSRYDRALVATDKNNFMPRLGFAFKLSEKTVIRSGYGLFYAYMENMGDSEFLIGNAPFAYGVTLTGSSTTPAVRLSTGPPPGATDLSKATGLQFSSYERHPKMSSAHQWNFDIQREFGQDWLVDIGYSGSRGLHLVRQYDANFSPAGPGSIDAKRTYTRLAIPGTGIVASPLGPVYSHRYDGNSIYHAMIAKVEKRFSQGFTVLSSYTWSKTIGDTCGSAVQGNTTGCGFQNLFNLRSERSVDNQDIPHRFVSSVLYDLPFGKGRPYMAASPAVVNGILGGWSVGSIVTLASAVPYNPTVQGNPANTGTYTVVQRPNIAGSAYSGARTLQRDFNVDAFIRPANFTYGNAGRNILRGRSQFNWDFSALKNFQLLEHLRLQFRFEAFTFTNTPRFNAPGNVLGTASFGVITGAATPRNLQFGLKLIW
ncbi:MAG: TonB-dependent receptor [Candidatus Solibacter usitatus]|nr:TonB-dependent receptor [Candidatus Solibacter usitatus]